MSFWGPRHFLTLILFIHKYLSCQALMEQSRYGPCLQGADSRHKSLTRASGQEESVGNCMVTHLHIPDFLWTDRHFLSPSSPAPPAVIADPSRPLGVSAQRWSSGRWGGGMGGVGVLTAQVTKRRHGGELADNPAPCERECGLVLEGRLCSYGAWMCQGQRLVIGTSLPVSVVGFYSGSQSAMAKTMTSGSQSHPAQSTPPGCSGK